MPGSVMPIAVISSPEAMPGSHRCFCSSVQYARKYGTQMSLCRLMPSPAPESGVRSSSSTSTALKRKSGTPPPPYSSGTSIPSNPCRPAAANSSRGVAPAALQASTCGRISLSTNVRAVARKASWSSSYSVRRMRSSLVPARSPRRDRARQGSGELGGRPTSPAAEGSHALPARRRPPRTGPPGAGEPVDGDGRGREAARVGHVELPDERLDLRPELGLPAPLVARGGQVAAPVAATAQVRGQAGGDELVLVDRQAGCPRGSRAVGTRRRTPRLASASLFMIVALESNTWSTPSPDERELLDAISSAQI